MTKKYVYFVSYVICFTNSTEKHGRSPVEMDGIISSIDQVAEIEKRIMKIAEEQFKGQSTTPYYVLLNNFILLREEESE